MNKPAICSALLVIGVGVASPACADIFAYADENGAISLSNRPLDSRYALMLQDPDEHSMSSESEPIRTAPAALSAMPFGALVEEAARTANVDSALLHAVITAESNYNARAVSHKGAVGLMQLMPASAQRYGVNNRSDPAENVRGGARYLKDLLKLFGNDLRLTLAAYNAGENTVARFGNRIPPYRETQEYVRRVMELYATYRASHASWQ